MKIELKPNSNSQNMYNNKKNARVKISKSIKELDNYWYTTLCETCLILLNFYSLMTLKSQMYSDCHSFKKQKSIQIVA